MEGKAEGMNPLLLTVLRSRGRVGDLGVTHSLGGEETSNEFVPKFFIPAPESWSWCAANPSH